ncbi:MAG: mshA 3, partial [Lacunisphaera sp.]|nr:mshA 3 [Lacunisphaera sp.]
VANTLVAFWAMLVAHRLAKPSIFYVHESVGARRFFALQFPPFLVEQVERAFTLATRVAFPASAARRPHLALDTRGNFRVLPGWIDVARIKAYDAAHSRDELRRAAGLPGDAVVFANIGSLLPRKGQHVFLAAVELLRQRAPAAPPLIFLLVGAKPGPDPYVDLLRHTLATQSLSDVRVIAQSPDPYQYFKAADICVCSSLEEALPRVLMEAAVFGRLIVSTDVNGIPELLGPEEAWLVPPDDPRRLADAMQAALDAHLRGDRRRAERAQAAVISGFDAARLLPKHADLVRSVAALPPS